MFADRRPAEPRRIELVRSRRPPSISAGGRARAVGHFFGSLLAAASLKAQSSRISVYMRLVWVVVLVTPSDERTVAVKTRAIYSRTFGKACQQVLHGVHQQVRRESAQRGSACREPPSS